MLKWYFIGTAIICVSGFLFRSLGLWTFIPLLIGAGIQVGCFIKAHMDMKALQMEYDALQRGQRIGLRDHDSPS